MHRVQTLRLQVLVQQLVLVLLLLSLMPSPTPPGNAPAALPPLRPVTSPRAEYVANPKMNLSNLLWHRAHVLAVLDGCICHVWIDGARRLLPTREQMSWIVVKCVTRRFV